MHDRRSAPRSSALDPLYSALRLALSRAASFYTAVGIFVLAGAVVAVAGTFAFAWIADHVIEGQTQTFDTAVLRWMGTHQLPWLSDVMVELTALGTGLVVMTMVAVAALFLWLTRHRHSAVLLLVSTAGAIVLNNILKVGFERPRPQVFQWGTHVTTSSFPSGHAMSAAAVYATIAYLAARLQEQRASRVATLVVAALVIVLISVSRVYLGVHYPSDVVAGVAIGIAWAAFCMATLEMMQRLARMRAPREARNEQEPAGGSDGGGRA